MIIWRRRPEPLVNYPWASAVKLARIEAILDAAENGEYAIAANDFGIAAHDFGRGVAYLAQRIRAVVDS